MTWPHKYPLEKLNSLTKYPSIPTFHALGERGRLTDEVPVNFDPTEDWEAYEKIDGTNARLILTEHGWFIGSREELLTFESDVVRNPALGIVQTLLPRLEELPDYHGQGEVLVIWGEVYGSNIAKAAKQYTSTDKAWFRAFDAARFGAADFERLMRMSPEVLAAWRERGGQPFVSAAEREGICREIGLDEAPLIVQGMGPLPRQLDHVAFWLGQTCPARTGAGIDAHGTPEGLILRNRERTKIVKLRLEDYARSLGKGQGARLIEIAQQTQPKGEPSA